MSFNANRANNLNNNIEIPYNIQGQTNIDQPNNNINSYKKRIKFLKIGGIIIIVSIILASIIYGIIKGIKNKHKVPTKPTPLFSMYPIKFPLPNGNRFSCIQNKISIIIIYF